MSVGFTRSPRAILTSEKLIKKLGADEKIHDDATIKVENALVHDGL
jgi:hypothetical protein